MLTTTKVHVCLRCGSERIRKNGHTVRGAQRAKCLECARTFILEPKGPRYDDAFKETVVAASQDRMSYAGLQRTFGVCYQSVVAWAGEKNQEPASLRGHAPACREKRRARTR